MALTIATVVAAVAIGCGGNGAELSAGASAAGKREFLARANDACGRENATVPAEVAEFLDQRSPKGKPSPIVYADLAHFVLLPTIEAQIYWIEKLGAPGRDEERVAAMLTAERLAIDKVATTRRVASMGAVSRPFKRSARLFRVYGLDSCANGPEANGG
jgi:hypothetical protein